jgi:uncharacterized protein (DUF983 family)
MSAQNARETQASGEGRHPSRPSWFIALLRQRCPRCRRGQMFRGHFAMNELCPVCELIFEREPGYFLGAMYLSYGICSLIMIVLYLAFQALFPNWYPEIVILPCLAIYLPFVPWVFRISRTIWIFFDRSVAPSEASSPEAWSKWKQEEGRS